MEQNKSSEPDLNMHEINGENMDYLIGGETTMILYNSLLEDFINGQNTYNCKI